LLALCGILAVADAQTMPSVTPGISDAPATGGAASSSTIPGTGTQGNGSAGQSVPNAAMLYPGEDFQLGPGDLISVRVFGSNEYIATVRVGTEGTVDLPYIGRIDIQRLSLREAQL
jgi:protein involved in polysaccharide export with SLBB domain